MKAGVFASSCVAMAMGLTVHGAETVGLWVFDGMDGAEIPNETVLPNLIPGSSLEMVTGYQFALGESHKETPLTYSDDIPAKRLFGDLALTNCIAQMKSSVKFAGYNHKGGKYMRVNGFGSLLKGESFTCEVLMRLPPRPAGVVPCNLLGVSGIRNDDYFTTPTTCQSPALSFSQATSEGCLAIFDGAIGENHASVNVSSSQLRQSNFGDRWRHYALVWNEQDKKGFIFCNYGDNKAATDGATAIANMVATHGGLTIDDGSYFQVFGMIGKMCRFYENGEVAAVRISKGVRSWNEFMGVWDDEVPTTLAHWRFSAPQQDADTTITNSVKDLDAFAMRVVCDDSPIYSNEVPLPYLRLAEKGDVVTNENSLSALANDVSTKFRIDAINNPAFWTGSFTLELILRASSVCKSTGLPILPFGRGYLRVNNSATPRLNFRINGASGGEIANPGPDFTGYDKWTRVVIQYDAENGKAISYLDEAVASADLAYATVKSDSVFFLTSQNMLSFFNAKSCGLANGVFNGLVDEIRFTRGVLAPADFLTPRKRLPGGMVLIFR